MADNPLRNLLLSKGIITQAELRAHDGDDVNEALKREFEKDVNTVLADLCAGLNIGYWRQLAETSCGYVREGYIREAFRRWESEEK